MLWRRQDYQIVGVQVKVIKKAEPVEVKLGLMKQVYTISDATACAQLVVWQEDINIGESYVCEKLVVRT